MNQGGGVLMSREPQAPQPTLASKPLSCTNCRQRKIKCNRVNPCAPCLKAGIHCISPTRRAQAPRSRVRGVREARDAELLSRIKRLEGLVSKVDHSDPLKDGNEGAKESQARDSASAPQSSTSTAPSNDNSRGGRSLEDQYAFFIKEQTSGNRYLGADFWTSLGNEFDDLKQLLENPVESDEEEFNGSASDSTQSQTTDSAPSFIFQDSEYLVDQQVPYPSDHDRTILLQKYFANVHPLCRILHKPTSDAHTAGVKAFIDPATKRYRFASLEAIGFAMDYSALTSMSTQECLTNFGKEKAVLIAQAKRGTEIALARADVLNTMEIITLQAFTLYIMALRSNSNSRSSWALIALAVRIAQGLGLHRDSDGRSFNAFEAEMRSRIWWQLIVLDMRASDDRGSEPVIQDGSFSTKMPHNLNEAEFGYHSQHPLPNRKGITEMAFSLISYDVSNTGRKINFVPLADDRRPLTLPEKEQLVKDCTNRIENIYLAGSDPSDKNTWVVRMIGRLLILRLWCVIQYPLQSRSSTPQDFPRGQSLRTVSAYLTLIEMIEDNEVAANFKWFFKTYVPWHALAVALAELCNETQGPLADQTWAVIDRNYNMWSERIADARQGMLWRPVKSLLKRARAARERTIEPFAKASVSSSVPGPISGDSELLLGLPQLNLGGSDNNTFVPPARDIGQENQLVNPLLEQLDPFAPLDFGLMTTDQPSLEPVNWDNWNEFIFDVGALDTSIPDNLYEDWSMHM